MLLCLKRFPRINFLEFNERGYMLVLYCDKMMDELIENYSGPGGFTPSGTTGDRYSATEQLDG
jgi:hypothetical protein